MILTDGYADVPRGKIAAVVTSLEMLAPPANAGDSSDGSDGSNSANSANSANGSNESARWDLRHIVRPDPLWYRDLFKRVGEPWLWFSRLMMLTPELISVIQHPHVEVYALWKDGCAEGILELDFRVDNECELSFFGVTKPLIGSGAGRHMMNCAIARAWSHPTRPIRRFWLHTCSLDHPGAIGFYVRSGFVAYRRQIEIANDPRLTGRAIRTAAPHVPMIP